MPGRRKEKRMARLQVGALLHLSCREDKATTAAASPGDPRRVGGGGERDLKAEAPVVPNP